MEKIKEKLKENSLTILIFILIILILTIPLMQNKLIYGDDMWYHLLRIQSIADSFKCKSFFLFVIRVVILKLQINIIILI